MPFRYLPELVVGAQTSDMTGLSRGGQQMKKSHDVFAKSLVRMMLTHSLEDWVRLVACES